MKVNKNKILLFDFGGQSAHLIARRVKEFGFDVEIVHSNYQTKDVITSNFARIPYDVLEGISSRITNEIKEVNRVVYDISNKPPATMEWE